MSLLNGMVEWTRDVFVPMGGFGLFILSFIEASFFPVPVETLLFILCLANPENALFYALVATIGSIFGGVFGYYIGYLGEMIVLEKLFSKRKIEKVHRLFNKYGWWAVFVGGFTPLPYKIFTIASGVFYIDFKKFVSASFLSRGLRFFVEAILLMVYGKVILSFFDKHFGLISIIVVICLIIGYWVYRKYFREHFR